MIAGRCECGMVIEWVIRKPDEHLRCFGLRWCGKCGEAAEFMGACVPCRRKNAAIAKRRRLLNPEYHARHLAKQRAYVRKRLRVPSLKQRHRDIQRAWAAKARRTGHVAYEREKERKRLRYRNDPEFAQRVREGNRRAREARKAA